MRIRGRVTEGRRIGRGLGYPTANISVDDKFHSQDGVYAAAVQLEGKGYGAMANLGVNPTFSNEGQRILEIHILDFNGDLYGKTLEVELLEFVRSERKFTSPEELRTQIEKDKEIITQILKRKNVLRS